MKVNVQDIWIDRAGMAAILGVSLGYILFGASFAQLHIQFSFLNFPIFIGEILLAFCFLLFILKNARQKWEFGRWGWMLGVYLFFVLLKAWGGYFSWGPLALRDAALFYYPLFIIIGYSFWSLDSWGDKTRRLILVLIIALFILDQLVAYWPCTLIILGVILALQAKKLQERMIFTGAIFIFAPYGEIFNVFFRTGILALLVTTVFISVMFFFLFCHYKWLRIVGAVLGCLIIGITVFKVSQKGVWKTFIINNAKPLVGSCPQEVPRGKFLFHPVGDSAQDPNTIKKFLHRIRRECTFMEKKPDNSASIIKESAMLDNKANDALFRYYIWRDMGREYAQFRPLFGFDFGRPLRSPAIIYYWNSSTEKTDGWIGAHNSFLYILYRAGIVGVIMILLLFGTWIGLLRDFYILKDWQGILLCAVFLNWVVSASFFLIFELPYTAIPVWTILGITLKHRTLLKK